MATRIIHLPKYSRLSCLVKPLTISARTFATATASTNPPQFTTLSVDDRTGIATLTLNRPPANALNALFMGEIQRSITDLEKENCRGLILTSSSERIFSAGLDLKECYKAEVASLEGLWCALQNLWRTLFSTPLITVALINGHAIAGGCMLAVSSEYRIMLPSFKIGVNETMVGLAVPSWLMDTYINIMPSRRIAEWDLTSSRIYSSESALKAGLVDELASSKEEALQKSAAFIDSFSKRTLMARAITKQQFRAEILRNFEQNRQHDLDIYLSTMQKPSMQEFLGEYLQSLDAKKK
ncbi:unnamed protein product [Ceratitis capitata]|uniref:(Mediterranean fruit fly) hypothetical protein n=2 Tax=Ceratitis capitata TaxID=7213 RepID=A0A811UF40_CERCA|nr:unnamed protein product [Ceratitis capitata]